MVQRKSLLERSTDFINWLMGSWLGVTLHAIWFAVWLYYDFSVELLTLAVSLEAIFIGIFLLMAANEAERAREIKEAREREKERSAIRSDVSLDEEQLSIIKTMKKDLEKINTELAEVKAKLYNTRK